MAKFALVNERDEIVGAKPRDQMLDSEIYRVASLWVINSKGKVLIAQRSMNKKHNPGKWGPSCAGTVEEGESYLGNIIKEAEEELGLKNINPVEGPKNFVHTDYCYFRKLFKIYLDKEVADFNLQEDEVIQIRWISVDDLIDDIRNYPNNYVKSMRDLKNYRSFLVDKNKIIS